MSKRTVSSWQLAVLAALFIAATDNGSLFVQLADRLELASWQGGAFVLTVFLLITAILSGLFLLLGPGRLLKPVIILTLVLSALLAHFTNRMGVVFDSEMMRNVFENVRDRDAREALELLSGSLLLHVLALGILPACAVALLPVTRRPLLIELRDRVAFTGVSLAMVAGLVLANYKYATYFGAQNKELRFQITPLAALDSLARYVEHLDGDEVRPFITVGGDAVQRKADSRRIVGVMVVGETARADHFSLNGYARDTNPLLEHEQGLEFIEAKSCGTSTAFSVPCMFSMRGRNEYDPDTARSESNVLDILSHAGVRIVWIDDNSSCKGVCARVENVNLLSAPDPASPLFVDGGYYDEALLPVLDRYLDGESSDVLIVLHVLGSHGPAYSHRYPERFGVYRPYCSKNAPNECDDSEVVNAYDNTIVYTDFILDSVIERLRAYEDRFDSFLFYASDHGESLGENGVYLHGLPYNLAPRAQIEIPMIVWLSDGYRTHHWPTADIPARYRGEPLSHDNISHTLIGLFDVCTAAYDRNRDLFRLQETARTANAD